MLIMYMKKHRRNSWQIKFWKRVRAICNLHSCYRRSFSANQKGVIISCTLLIYIFFHNIQTDASQRTERYFASLIQRFTFRGVDTRDRSHLCQSVQDGVEKLKRSRFGSIHADIIKPAGLKTTCLRCRFK